MLKYSDRRCKMYAVADIEYEQKIGSPVQYMFAYDPEFVRDRISEEGIFEVTIEDLTLLTSG